MVLRLISSSETYPTRTCTSNLELNDCEILLLSRLWDATYHDYDNYHDGIIITYISVIVHAYFFTDCLF